MMNIFKSWFKTTNAASRKSYCELRSFMGFPCSSQEELRYARKNDMLGNYDIDGMSYDGNSVFIGGRMEKPNT